MKKLAGILISLFLMGMCVFGEEKEIKKKIELKDIPKEVLAAAKEKVKFFEAKEAVVKNEKESKEYEIKGTAKGKEIEVEVKVDKDGKITKVEIEEAKKEGDGDGD